MNRIFKKSIILLAAGFLFAACDRYEGDLTAPAYLEIGTVTLKDNPADSWSPEDGFFTSAIDAVNVIVWQEGDEAETDLGTYNLPCRIPVLKQGNIDIVRVVPVVKQNGIAGTRIAYPFFETLTLNNIQLTTDSVTRIDTLETHYISHSVMSVLWKEFFEPGPGAVNLDTVVSRLVYKSDTVRSGYGCGVIRIPDSVTALNFWADTTCHIGDPGAVLYLEMDYWSDFDFSVGLKNPSYSGGSDIVMSAMTIYGKPEAGWQKIYINLGKIWSQTYRHYPDIRLYFTAFNPDHKNGSLFIDNMKLIAM